MSVKLKNQPKTSADEKSVDRSDFKTFIEYW